MSEEREVAQMLILSTGHMLESDALNLTEGPYFRAEWADGRATLWHIPDETSVPEKEIVEELKELGFSPIFVESILFLRREKYAYALFDADGPEYNDLPKFDW